MSQPFNPLASFQEMGTLSKVLLLLGFVFLVAVLFHGASFSDRMLPASLAFISLSLAVHYFSGIRTTVIDEKISVTTTHRGKVWGGIILSMVTIGLIVWAALVPAQKPNAATAPSTETSKPTDVPTIQKEPKDQPAPAATSKPTPEKPQPPVGKNRSSANGTHAAGDNSAAIGSVNQGPCSVLQAGGSNNQATGGNCAPQPRLPSEKISQLATSLSAQHWNVSIDVRNADSITSEDANNLLVAFAKAGWNRQGVNQTLHGTDIGDNGLPVPEPKGIHIYARSQRQDVARFVQTALKSIGIQSHVETDDSLNDYDVKILVAAIE